MLDYNTKATHSRLTLSLQSCWDRSTTRSHTTLFYFSVLNDGILLKRPPWLSILRWKSKGHVGESTFHSMSFSFVIPIQSISQNHQECSHNFCETSLNWISWCCLLTQQEVPSWHNTAIEWKDLWSNNKKHQCLSLVGGWQFYPGVDGQNVFLSGRRRDSGWQIQ